MTRVFGSGLEFDSDSELLWLAVRYLTGELGRDDVEAFERRLDQEQAAREALAQAVELAGAIATLPAAAAAAPGAAAAPVVSFPLGGRNSIIAVFALAAAAAILWLLVLPRGPVAPPEDGRGKAVDHAHALARAGRAMDSAAVALAWSTLREACDVEGQDPDLRLASNDELPHAGLGESDLEPANLDEAAEEALPLWLLDAATLTLHRKTGPAPAKEL
jgi:hypothetical protein